MKNFILLFIFACYVLVSFSAFSQQESSQNQQQNAQPEEQTLSKAELAQMLAPIALYPDSLLTHILIASTYPIEIVEAYRWLKKNDKLSAKQIAKSIENFDWDASVKALVPFEKVLSRLSDDLSWMQQLGDAFLQDETRVLESIQALRAQAKNAGNLDKMANMDVSYEDNNIIIEPVEKEIVYVPYYDTRMVYGNWYWSSYPPVYWRPVHRVHLSHHNPFYWHSGIRISFNFFFSAFHWHNRHLVVVNSHRSPHRYYHQRPRRLIANGGYAKRWAHKPVHRKGVAYRTKQVSQKYRSHSAKGHKNRKSAHYTQRDFKQALSSKNHLSSKRKANNKQVRHNKNLRNTTKQHSERVDHKAPRQQKVPRPNANFKNKSTKQVVPKAYKDRASKPGPKYHGVPVKKQKNTSPKPHHQSKSAKKHHSHKTKQRH